MAKKGKSTKPLKEPKHDEEGKIMNWDSNWDDALVLRMYIEKGWVQGLTALKIQEKYPETYGKYTNKALTGGLKTLRDSVAKEFAAARAGGSNVLQTHTNLGLGTIPENAAVGEAAAGDKPNAIDVNDVSDAISRLGFEDSVFGEASTVAFKSVFQQAVDKGEKVAKLKTLHGNTECGLPYIVDMWRDSNGRVRISLQIWLLSGDDFFAKVVGRVASSGKAFVLGFPMDPFMERSDLAFSSFIMDKSTMAKFQNDAMLYVIKNHPKSIARIQSVSKVKQRQQSLGGRYYEQRIPLPRKVMHQFATDIDGDCFFSGLKFIKNANGSVHMHVEMMGEVKDSYTPEERKQAPVTKIAKPLTIDVPVAMNISSGASVAAAAAGPTGRAVGGATVIENEFQFDDAGSRGRATKRRGTGADGTPVGSPHSAGSQSTNGTYRPTTASDFLQGISQLDPAQLQALQQAMMQQQAQTQQQAQAQALQQAQAQAQAQQQAQAQAQQQAQQQAQAQALAEQQAQAQALAEQQAQQQQQGQPFMYPIDGTEAGPGSMDILSDDEDDEEDDEDASTLYDEVTVHSNSPMGQSAGFDFNASGLEQLAFASSLQKAAHEGGDPVFHAQ